MDIKTIVFIQLLANIKTKYLQLNNLTNEKNIFIPNILYDFNQF
jgi:hypothetical protein